MAERQVKKNEDSLPKELLSFEYLASASPWPCAIKNNKGVYVFCNPLFAKKVSISNPLDVVGLSDKDMPWHDSAELIQTNDDEIINENLAAEFKLGDSTYFKFPIHHSNGKVYGIFCLEKEPSKVESSFHVLHEIISVLPIHIYWKDRKGVLQGCNDLQAKDLGLKSPEEIVGKKTFDLIWKNQPQQERQKQAILTDQTDDKIMEANATRSMEEFAYKPDGSEAYYWSIKTPLHDRDGSVSGLVGISININERKKLENELLKAKDAAESANQAKTEFLENMRHDIRTPLTGIVGFSDIIKSEAENPSVKEYADNLVASSHALLTLMDEVLEAVRVSSGEIPGVKKKFSIKNTLQHIINLNSAKAASKRLDLQFDYDDSIPKYLLGDNIRIHRIALELLANALNFTDSGSVSLSAKLGKLDDQKAVIQLTIKDTGMGIPKDRQQEIFVQFKRLTPSYEGIYKGAGLGLFVIKQFIDEINGELYVESEPHKGSTFTCFIPLQVPLVECELGVDSTFDSADLTPETGAMPKHSITQETKAPESLEHKALIVEDNEVAANIAQALLKKQECASDIAHDGKTAIELFKKNDYDIVIMDIGLPDMDGYEVTHHIRLLEISKKHHTPIVALTAHAGEENKQRCIEAGMSAVITKPLSFKHCQELLDSFIPSRKKKEEQEAYKSDLPEQDSELFDLESYPLLDEKEGAKASGSEEMLKTMLQILMGESLTEDLNAMSAAFEKKDWEKVQKLAHKIKGGAVYLGVIRMKMACQYLERYWKSGQSELMDKLYLQAVDVIEQTMSHVDKWLKEQE